MLTVILATSTAALFGSADFFGGLASRRDSAFIVTATAHILGVFILGTAAVFMPYSAVTQTDVLLGAVAGVSGGLGVVSLYAGLAAGRMSIVAPLTAALSGSLPAVFDLFTGGSISPIDGAGLALALGAVVMVSVSGHSDDEHGVSPKAVALAIGAGFGFAGSWIAFSYTGVESGLWPVVSARLTSAALLASIAFVRTRRVLVEREVRRSTVAAGVLDSAANITMISAIRSGPLAVASVLGSLYPVITVVLAFGVLRERVTLLQKIGITVALVAVVLTGL